MQDLRVYKVDENLNSHIQLDFDLSCNRDGDLNKSIIYVLETHDMEEQKCLYVGQTNVNPITRLKIHIDNLMFDTVKMKQLKTNDRNEVNSEEQKYIEMLKPILQHKFTTFEKQNSGGKKSYKDVLKWIECQNTKRRPGRPRTKEPSKLINVAVPIRLYEQVIDKCGKYGLNITQYINSLIEKDMELIN